MNCWPNCSGMMYAARNIRRSFDISDALWGPGMSIATTPGFLTSAVERSREVGEAIIDNSQIEAGDVLVVISSSGKNACLLYTSDAADD